MRGISGVIPLVNRPSHPGIPHALLQQHLLKAFRWHRPPDVEARRDVEGSRDVGGDRVRHLLRDDTLAEFEKHVHSQEAASIRAADEPLVLDDDQRVLLDG